MHNYLGVVFALTALVCWGVGDFLIQKTTRKCGDFESLFIIALVGSIILFPFALPEILSFPNLFFQEINLLLFISVVFFASALVNTEALRRGKLAVIEPIGALEIITAGILAFLIFGEELSFTNWIFVFLLLSGIFLVVIKPHHFRKETWIERGALLAFSGATIMGLTDFMVSFGAKVTSPIVTVWVFNVVMVVITLSYMQLTGRFRHFLKDFRLHKDLMSGVGLLDNLAWLSFALATKFIPVVIALALSESYIILATILGIVINKEKLKQHQFVGIAVASIGLIAISVFYS